MNFNKINCWEYKYLKDTNSEDECSICSAFLEIKMNGINKGFNGGRCCWLIAGIINSSNYGRITSKKFANCMKCPFYKLVQKEEGVDFKSAKQIYEYLKT